MKKLLLFLLSISLLSSSVIIDDSDRSYKDFPLSLYQDKTEKLTLKDIQDLKSFQKITNRVALGKQEGNVWLHFSIENRTQKKQRRVLFITEPNLWDVELFIVSNKKIISTQAVGQNIIHKDGKIASFHPEVAIDLDAEEKVDIYIRSSSPFHHTFKVDITTDKDLVNYKIFKYSLLSLYFGAIGALLLYNLFIYFSIRDKNYLLYIGFIFFYSLAQFQHSTPFNSLFSSMNITYFIAVSHIFWVAFHTLFSVKLLNIKEYYPKLDKYLLYTGYFLLAVGFFGIYSLEIGIQVIHPFMIILPFLLLFSAVKLHLKKNKLAIFYIIAQTLFLTSSLIFGLVFAGVLEYNNFTRYINFVGSFSEIILFSFALAYKTRLLLKENQNQKELVDEYSKLSFLGQTIINIYHQWKSPVNNIYNSINHIEIAKEFQDKNINAIIDENLIKIKENTQYLKDTSISYLNYYKGIDQPKAKFTLIEELSTILKLHQQEFEKIALENRLDCPHNIRLYTQKNILTNCLIILIENAINVFKQRSIKDPKLSIEVREEEGRVVITITDNGGGIKLKNIDEIFEKNHSISSSTGLGLYLLREFLLPKIEATVRVENYKDGARFTIVV